MKSKLTKQIPARQICLAIGGLFVLSGVNSCKMPSSTRYAQADWSVQTSVTKEDYPVGVSLEDISDEPLPSPEEIALGLPNHTGSSKTTDPWSNGTLKTDSQGRVAELPLNSEILSPVGVDEAPMPGTAAGDNRARPLKDALVGRAEPSLPSPTNAASPDEVRPARVNTTPENLALMAAASVRPYLPPRGTPAPEAKPAADTTVANARAASVIPAPPTPLSASAPPPPATVASAAPLATNHPSSAPASEDLAEILKLAKKVEGGRKR